MRKRLVTVLALCGVAAGAAAFARPNQRVSRGVARYEYVAGVGKLSVYNIANRSLVGRLALPGVAEIRGIGASAATGMLYVSYGGFPKGTGHLLEFSLYRRKVVYDRGYRFGIDSFDISHDGRLIFMPTGENTSGNTWHVLAATTGRVVGAIAAGRSPHDTVVGASGQHVFLGGASTATSTKRTSTARGRSSAGWDRSNRAGSPASGRSRSMLRTRSRSQPPIATSGFRSATSRLAGCCTPCRAGFSVPPTSEGSRLMGSGSPLTSGTSGSSTNPIGRSTSSTSRACRAGRR